MKKKFGSSNTTLHYCDLTDKAAWVYDHYDPCTIIENDNGYIVWWTVDVCGDVRECDSVSEINDFLESCYDGYNDEI